MKTVTLKRGDIVFREHDMGDAVYRIRNGEVKIIAGFGTETEQTLTVLTDNAFFGEMSILEAWVRSATAVVSSETAALEVITAVDLDRYFSERSDRIMDIMRHLSGRLRVLTGDYREACETLAGMKPDEPRQPENLLARIRRFASAFAAGRDEAEALKHAALRAASAERDENTQAAADALSAGDVLFREGDEGRCMYRLLRGEMGIYSGYGTPEQKRLTTILPKSYFGEMGLIDHAPRSATAAAMKKGTKVEAIYEEDLAKIFREKPDEIHEMLRQLVFRLRRLTADYLEVCRLIAVMERARKANVFPTRIGRRRSAWRRRGRAAIQTGRTSERTFAEQCHFEAARRRTIRAFGQSAALVRANETTTELYSPGE